jgi:hypothetical protein
MTSAMVLDLQGIGAAAMGVSRFAKQDILHTPPFDP